MCCLKKWGVLMQNKSYFDEKLLNCIYVCDIFYVIVVIYKYFIFLYFVFGKRCNFLLINMYFLFIVDYEFYFDDMKNVYFD